ncbi:hypothetical protein QVD17_01532 [Tagetes erecta]|uniref:Uncharacterized protein n=1 Tax=Tagetes erecta TaxID=13708 RepID=A0AAD8L7D8_TARER|nr:hypothetical protein QVD17_01532 [Tagetes erecta]
MVGHLSRRPNLKSDPLTHQSSGHLLPEDLLRKNPLGFGLNLLIYVACTNNNHQGQRLVASYILTLRLLSSSTSLRSGHRNLLFRSQFTFLLSSSGELGFFVCNHGGGFGAIYQLSFCSFK